MSTVVTNTTSSPKILAPMYVIDTENKHVDLSGETVEFTTLAPGETPDGTTAWNTGSWELIAGLWTGTIVIGPAGVFDPGEGTWAVWVQLITSEQTVAARVGTLVVE